MVLFNTVLLSLSLSAAVLARPNQHEKLHHKRVPGGLFQEIKPSGIHGAPPSGYTYGTAGSTAPFPAGNKTSGAATATGSGAGSGGSGPVTISSIITVVPLPQTALTSGAGASGQSQPNSPQTGSPAGSGSTGVCGPATVTVTSANTVTITVPAAGGQTSSSAVPTSQNVVQENSSGVPYLPTSSPASSPAALPATSPATSPVSSPTSSAKIAVAAASTTSPAAAAPAVEDKHVQPANAAPYSSITQGSTTPANLSPPTSQTSSTAPSASPSTSPSSDNVKAKGIIFSTLPQGVDTSALGWFCDWDSSPTPSSGHYQASLNLDYVPQLWGPTSPHTDLWAENSGKGATWVMAFNEPNQPVSAGGCGPYTADQTVTYYEQYMQANKANGQKIVSPAVSNDASEFLDSFLSKATTKPDAAAFHWYGNSLDELKGVVSTFQAIQQKHSISELWMTEWALNSPLSSSDMADLMTWLDGSAVNRHAYNMDRMASTPSMKSAFMAA